MRTRLNRPSKYSLSTYQTDGLRLNTLKPKTWLTIILIIMLTAFFVYIEVYKRDLSKAMNFDVYAQENISGASAELKPETDEQAEIIAYIKEVFGKNADEAFMILSCENKGLRPDAVNTTGNTPAGSRDIGIFQINEYWQKVQGKFLFNWKINVDIAHQLYTENGNSFKLWSCNKKVGLS